MAKKNIIKTERFNSNITFTPKAICKKLVDNISVDDFKKAENVLNICSGSGIISIELIDKMITGGLSPKEVISKLYLVDINQQIMDFSINTIKIKYGYAPRYKVVDALSWDFDNMKFDYIIGNPPYDRYKVVDPTSRYYSANAHMAFQWKSSEHLVKNGKIIFVVPTNFLLIKTGKSFRKTMYNNGRYSKFTIIDKNPWAGQVGGGAPGKISILEYTNTREDIDVQMDVSIGGKTYNTSFKESENIKLFGEIVYPILIGDIGKNILYKCLEKSKYTNLTNLYKFNSATQPVPKSNEKSYFNEKSEINCFPVMKFLDKNGNIEPVMWSFRNDMKHFYENKFIISTTFYINDYKKDILINGYVTDKNCLVHGSYKYIVVPSKEVGEKLKEIINYDIIALWLAQTMDNNHLMEFNIGRFPLPKNIMDIKDENDFYINFLNLTDDEIKFIHDFRNNMKNV